MTKCEQAVGSDPQDIDVKSVEANYMDKICPRTPFSHKLSGSFGYSFCFYTYNINVL